MVILRPGDAKLPDLSYRSPKTAVQESPIHGRGLFAREPIVRGEVAARLGPAEIPVADGFFIGPRVAPERDGGMIFSNHSCDPNLGIQGQIVFVALRDIQPGEELTHDWATTDDDTYRMTCRCGAGICWGTITGKDWRRPDLREKYLGYMAWYLQRKINAEGA